MILLIKWVSRIPLQDSLQRPFLCGDFTSKERDIKILV